MQEMYASPVDGPRDLYDEQPPLTGPQRVLNTFVAPTRTFADLRRNRSWWLPLLVLALFSYAFTLTALSRVGADRLAESAIRNNPAQYERMQQATPQARAQMIHFTALFMKISFFAWPAVMLLLSALGALLLWVGFNFILGGRGTYPGMFAVVMFSWLPSAIKSVLITAMLFLGDPDTFNLNDPVGTNPGFYMSSDSSPFVKTLLGSLDLFTLWTLVLLGVGGAIVARVRIRSGVVLVLVVWAIYALGRAALAAAAG